MILILMGVTGTGKTTVGQLLAKRLQWPFEDGDDYHPEANRLKMASGTPLTDEDRWPWLETIHTRLLQLQAENTSEVFACSALRQIYRDLLSKQLPPHALQFVLLTAPPALLAERLHDRKHPFMNPNLLESQLQTLEWPEDAWVVSVAGTPDQAADEIEQHLAEAG